MGSTFKSNQSFKNQLIYALEQLGENKDIQQTIALLKQKETHTPQTDTAFYVLSFLAVLTLHHPEMLNHPQMPYLDEVCANLLKNEIPNLFRNLDQAETLILQKGNPDATIQLIYLLNFLLSLKSTPPSRPHLLKINKLAQEIYQELTQGKPSPKSP